MWAQFLLFVERDRSRGEFGTSIAMRVPVTALILERLPPTLMLTALATVLAIGLAVPLAFVAATQARAGGRTC